MKPEIGIVGGMGSYATAYFFRRLLDSFPAQKEWERPRIVIDNNCGMPSRVRAILYQEDTEKLLDELSQSVTGLAAMGCTRIILACITSHYFLDRLRIEEPVRHSILDLLACTAAAAEGAGEIYICGSEAVAETKLWDRYFDVGTHLQYPEAKERGELRRFIEAVKQNQMTERIAQEYAVFLQELPFRHIILGCSELPVLFEHTKLQKKGSEKIFYDPLDCGILELKKEALL